MRNSNRGTVSRFGRWSKAGLATFVSRFSSKINVFFRPVDRIMSATSTNGVNWVRDRGVRIDSDSSALRDMVYFNHVLVESEGYRMFYHASSFREGVWSGNIFCATSRDGLCWRTLYRLPLLENAGRLLRHVQSPSLVKLDGNGGMRMYYIAEGIDGDRRVLSAISSDQNVWEVEPGVRIEHTLFDGVKLINDCSVQRFGDGFRIYLSAVKGPYTMIVSAFSSDGMDWLAEPGIRIEAGVPGRFLIANNPCVLSVNGEWWMYYRGGDKLAVDNCIYLAKSTDGLGWEVQGRVLGPDPESWYDCHAVGFPFVVPLPDGSFRMYYSGFWGKHLHSRRIVDQWEEATKRAYKEIGSTSL